MNIPADSFSLQDHLDKDHSTSPRKFAFIAPRPFCTINGEKDDIYPLAFAHEQFETVHRAYELHNASNVCKLHIHPGEHAYNNAMSQSWFSEWMKTTPKE